MKFFIIGLGSMGKRRIRNLKQLKQNDIIGFADVIERLINNKPLCESTGKKGRAFVVKHYDNKVLVNKLLEIYLS